MTIEQLPSGSYRIKQMNKGKLYTITIKYKPTKKEATILLAEKLQSGETGNIGDGSTILDYAEQYIVKKQNEGKSPSTIRGYNFIKNNTPEWFQKIRLMDVTENDWQKAVNEYYGEGKRSPKTVRNMNGFYKAILNEYRPKVAFSIKLPAIQKKIQYEPTTEDIKAILDYSKNSRYHIILQLAANGLRKGEAVVISYKDIDKENVLTIDKDLVVDKNNKRIIKDHPKTAASYRRIPISKELADEIRENKVAYNGYPNAINRYLNTAQDKLGIPRFSVHMMRHFCAAYLHYKGFTDEQVMQWMGWDDPKTMIKVYRYNLDPHKTISNMRDAISELL